MYDGRQKGNGRPRGIGHRERERGGDWTDHNCWRLRCERRQPSRKLKYDETIMTLERVNEMRIQNIETLRDFSIPIVYSEYQDKYHNSYPQLNLKIIKISKANITNRRFNLYFEQIYKSISCCTISDLKYIISKGKLP